MGTVRGTRRQGTVRLADVAREAQVSNALASRVLNDDEGVRATPETKARIVATAERLGYVPNAAAKSLRVQRNGLLGLVVHDLSSPIHLELMRGAREEASARGSFLVLADVHELLDDDDAFRVLVRGNRVDGLVIQGGQGEFDDRIAEIAQALPAVVVNAPAPTSSAVVSSVYPDEIAATRLLTEHLLALGHRRVGFVSGPEASTTSRLREEGVVAALAASGLSLHAADRVHGDWSADGGRSGFGELLSRWNADGSRPTALIAGNSLIGAGVIRAAADAGIAVPDDLSVAAVHDMWIAEHLVPSLTTVALPLREMGALAVRQLLTSGEAGATIVVTDPPPVLHVRGSTDRPS
ncbi:MAG: LacI family DNA-binding transcriptional regulator [Microbacterium sp.]